MLSQIIKNIRTHKVSAVLTVIISCLLMLFLLFYLGGIVSSQHELDNLHKALPVECKVVNPDGSWDRDLQIPASMVQKLEKTEMIKDVVKTASFYVDDTMKIYSEEEQNHLGFSTILASANAFAAFPYIDESTLYFAEEYTKDFINSAEAVCILQNEYMENLGLKVGDMYSASVYRKKYEFSALFYQLKYAADIKMKIIGSFDIDIAKIGNTEAPIAIAPIKFVREVFREADSPYSVHSMNFILKDARQLDQFKLAAEEIGFKPRNPQDGLDVVGKALVLYDESFIKTEAQLIKSIDLRQLLLPIIFTVVGAIALLISYLLMQSRKLEFAIMRSLGVGKLYSFFVTLLESLILSFIGGIAGSLIGLLLLSILLIDILTVLSIFLILYILGTAISTILLNRFSVMEILTKNE